MPGALKRRAPGWRLSTSSDDGAANTSVDDAGAGGRRRRGTRALKRRAAGYRLAAGRSCRHWPGRSAHNSACFALNKPNWRRITQPMPPKEFVVASLLDSQSIPRRMAPTVAGRHRIQCRVCPNVPRDIRLQKTRSSEAGQAGSAKKRAARVTGRPPAPSRGRGQRVAQPQAKPPVL